ncbi:MAG: hypothetical protein ACERKO_10570 [Acetanaerobacterium sp.]
MKPDFNAYLNRVFATTNEVTTAELPLENDSDFVCAMMLAMCDECKVKPLQGSIKKNGYSIPNLVVRRCR